MFYTIIGIICGLVILWAIEMHISEISKTNEELRTNILKIKVELDEIKNKLY